MSKEDHLKNIREVIPNVPTEPGCYLWLSAPDEISGEREVLYVGKAINLRARVRQYLQSDDYKTRFLMSRVEALDYVVTHNEVEALLLESNLIKKYSPQYNIRLKDDKRYPYLCLTMGEPFPRLIITRKKNNPKHLYFGPYSDAGAARVTLGLIHRLFPIRKRPLKLPLKTPARPCLNYHIGRCLAPCAQKVEVDEYREVIDQIRLFLEGKNEEVVDILNKQMQVYSEKMEYEKAARCRDILKDINELYHDQSVHADDAEDHYDIVGIYSVLRTELARSLEIDSEHLEYIPGNAHHFLSQVVLLRIRNGNLVNKGTYAMTEVPGDENDALENYHIDLIEGFFRDYYMQLHDLPPKIFVSETLPIAHQWEDALKKHVKISTKIIDPGTSRESPELQEEYKQRKSLIKMALNNARLTLRERILTEKIRNQRFGLRQIQKFLELSQLPRYIECYDISNIQGSEAVGCGVALKDGIAHKAGYRRYRIRTKDTPDDPAMMHEVLDRRMKRLASGEGVRPDLIIIDGGITQLRAAISARDENGVTMPIISLAKREEEIYTEHGEILSMDKNSPGMLIIRLARDEAHRFSVAYHRKLRKKRNLESVFDSIEGIGPEKRKKLMTLFQEADFSEEPTPKEEKSLKEKIAKITGEAKTDEVYEKMISV